MASTSLWQAYHDEGDPTARDELVAEHLRLVYHVAWQVMRSCPQEVEFDELVSAGTLGLMGAIETFDPSRGLAFSTLAAPRIRGAILDDLRKRDTVPRSVRRKQREVSRAREGLMRSLNRTPSSQETAEELGIELEEYWKWTQDTERAHTLPIDHPSAFGSESAGPQETNAALSDEEDLDDNLTYEEEVKILRDEILSLKHQDRMVVSLYYFQGLKLHEIAALMGVTESRISQIRSKAVKQLRVRLARLREGVVA